MRVKCVAAISWSLVRAERTTTATHFSSRYLFIVGDEPQQILVVTMGTITFRKARDRARAGQSSCVGRKARKLCM